MHRYFGKSQLARFSYFSPLPVSHSAEDALRLPVHTFASGPTNSMRGAAFLAGTSRAKYSNILL